MTTKADIKGTEGVYLWTYGNFNGNVESEEGSAIVITDGIVGSTIHAGENVIVDSLGNIIGTNITADGWVDIVSYDDISFLNITSDDGIYIDTYGNLDATAISSAGEIGIIANGNVNGTYDAGTDAWVFTYCNFDATLLAEKGIYFVNARGNISGFIGAVEWIGDIYSYGDNSATISAENIGYIEAYIPDEEHETNASITGKITASEWVGRILADGDITAEITSPEITIIRENDETAETWETISEAPTSPYDEIFEAMAGDHLLLEEAKNDIIDALAELQMAYKDIKKEYANALEKAKADNKESVEKERKHNTLVAEKQQDAITKVLTSTSTDVDYSLTEINNTIIASKTITSAIYEQIKQKSDELYSEENLENIHDEYDKQLTDLTKKITSSRECGIQTSELIILERQLHWKEHENEYIKEELAFLISESGSRASAATTTLNCDVCFAAGTPILMADGTSKPIEEIEIGDEVFAKPHDNPDGPLQKIKVTRVFHNAPQPTWILIFENQSTKEILEIEATSEHPFYVPNSGWKVVKSLKLGDVCISANETKMDLKSKTFNQNPQPVYNFEVENAHTYFVGKVIESCTLVHNDCDGVPSWASWYDNSNYSELRNKSTIFKDLFLEHSRITISPSGTPSNSPLYNENDFLGMSLGMHQKERIKRITERLYMPIGPDERAILEHSLEIEYKEGMCGSGSKELLDSFYSSALGFRNVMIRSHNALHLDSISFIERLDMKNEEMKKIGIEYLERLEKANQKKYDPVRDANYWIDEELHRHIELAVADLRLGNSVHGLAEKYTQDLYSKYGFDFLTGEAKSLFLKYGDEQLDPKTRGIQSPPNPMRGWKPTLKEWNGPFGGKWKAKATLDLLDKNVLEKGYFDKVYEQLHFGIGIGHHF